MFEWFAINTYSGHENKVRINLEQRLRSLGQRDKVREVRIPTETVIETAKDGSKVQTEKRVWPGYLLINMDLDDESWSLVKNTPSVIGFVGATPGGGRPVPLSRAEVERLLHTGTETKTRVRAEFTVGESVKIINGPLSDFTGEIAEVNAEAGRVKVLVSIFGRETPAELSFDQVKKLG